MCFLVLTSTRNAFNHFVFRSIREANTSGNCDWTHFSFAAPRFNQEPRNLVNNVSIENLNCSVTIQWMVKCHTRIELTATQRCAVHVVTLSRVFVCTQSGYTIYTNVPIIKVQYSKIINWISDRRFFRFALSILWVLFLKKSFASEILVLFCNWHGELCKCVDNNEMNDHKLTTLKYHI